MPKILNKYPVNDDLQIKTASAYFEDHWHRMSLNERVAYAKELSQVMKTAGLPLSKYVDIYSGDPRPSPQAGLDIRSVYVGEKHRDDLQELKKMAGKVPHEWLVNAIDTFDKKAKLQGSYSKIPDPHRTVFAAASEKTAARWRGATDTLLEQTLVGWVASHSFKESAAVYLTEDLVEGLRENPWVVFMSLPEPTKKVIARLANDSDFPGEIRVGRSEHDDPDLGDF